MPPQDRRAEQNVLSAMMWVPEVIDDVRARLAEGDFYYREQQLVFTAALELCDRRLPVSAAEVFEHQRRGGYRGRRRPAVPPAVHPVRVRHPDLTHPQEPPMPTATATTPSPTRPPACVGVDGRAPPGWIWVLLFRRRRTDPWVELLRAPTAEAVWRMTCEHRATGEYHPRLVRTGQVDACQRSGR